MADCSGVREQRMSGGLTTATRRQKKSSNLAASPSNSGKNEIRIGCPTLMTIYLSGISEAGRNIAEHSERPEAASTAESTALPSGISKIRGLAAPGPPVNTGKVLLNISQVYKLCEMFTRRKLLGKQLPIQFKSDSHDIKS